MQDVEVVLSNYWISWTKKNLPNSWQGMFLLVRQNGKNDKTCIDSSLWLVTYHLSVWIYRNLRFNEIPSTNVWESKACFSWLMNIARGWVTRANPILLNFPCLISFLQYKIYMYTYGIYVYKYDVYYTMYSPIVCLNTPFVPPAGVSDHLQTSAGTLWRSATTLEKIHMDDTNDALKLPYLKCIFQNLAH